MMPCPTIIIDTPRICSTLALSIEEPVDWTRFGIWLTMLLHRHGDAMLRIKGILNIADAVTPVAVHAVQHLVHTPRHLEAWPDEDRRSRLVFIARGTRSGSDRAVVLGFQHPAEARPSMKGVWSGLVSGRTRVACSSGRLATVAI